MDQAQYDSDIQKNQRHNFVVNAGDLISVNLARSFVFSTTILPLYVSYLTKSAVLIGLVPAILEVGFLLPQLFTARKAETLDRMKPYVVKVSLFERLPYLVIALFILLFPDAPSWLAYLVLAVNITIASGSGGLATPAWKTLLRKVIHPNRKAMLFALGMGLGGGLGIGGAWISRFMLQHYRFPYSYGFCFGLAFAAQMLSWGFLAMNREPPRRMATAAVTVREYFARLPALLRRSPNFGRYLVSQVFVILGSMGASFFIIYGKERLGVTDAFAATLTVIALVSQAIAAPIIGWLSDKFGHKTLTVLSVLPGIVAPVLVLLTSSPGWLAFVFILMNLSMAGLRITRNSITMEFSTIEELPTFTAISGTLLAFPTFIAPILGGWLIDTTGYSATFLVACVVSAAGAGITALFVHDPRTKAGVEIHG